MILCLKLSLDHPGMDSPQRSVDPSGANADDNEDNDDPSLGTDGDTTEELLKGPKVKKPLKRQSSRKSEGLMGWHLQIEHNEISVLDFCNVVSISKAICTLERALI